ncbi:hypothetical protein GCM10028801_30900 [Nocardioides maradonensis]
MAFNYESTCSGKVRHSSRKEAKHVARTNHPGVRLQAYLCDFCGTWHLGHPPSAVVRGIQDRRTWRGQ